MSTKKIQLFAGILLILAAIAELFSLKYESTTRSHKTTMTIMASAMTLLGILLIRKVTKKDKTA
jgi:hypothetical protein